MFIYHPFLENWNSVCASLGNKARKLVKRNPEDPRIVCFLTASATHSVHWGINPPSKHPLFLAKLPPLNQQTAQVPFFGQSLTLYWFFMDPLLKIGFFSEPQNIKRFPSLTPSYLLKVDKFLVKISQFEFLVITEKNIFAHNFFCH